MSKIIDFKEKKKSTSSNKIVLILIPVFIVLAFFTSVLYVSGCNNPTISVSNVNYNKASINIGKEVVIVDIDSYKLCTDDSVMVKDTEGRVYFTSLRNVILIKE